MSPTSTTLLFRALGNTIGTPIFGGILDAGLEDRDGRGADDFTAAVPPVFPAGVPVALIALLVSIRLPGLVLREHLESHHDAAPDEHQLAREPVLVQTEP